MSVNRMQIDLGANFVRAQMPGDGVLDQTQVFPITTAGAGTLTAAAMVAGIVDRSGPAGNYNETLDTADNLMAANPQLSAGDSFEFWYRNTVAFVATLVVAEGAELVANTAVAASKVRRYLVTILANARRQVFNASTTNVSPTITGLTAAQAQTLVPGMGVSGTGISAATNVLAVNSSTGTITLTANATATGTVPLTFFPRYNIKGISSADL